MEFCECGLWDNLYNVSFYCLPPLEFTWLISTSACVITRTVSGLISYHTQGVFHNYATTVSLPRTKGVWLQRSYGSGL
jgi:hypothetical protein